MNAYRSLFSAVAVATLLASSARAVDILIPAKIGIVKSGKLAKVVSKTTVPFTLPAPLSASDPAVNGATIRLLDTVVGFGTGGDVTFNLPAGAAWKKLGNPPGSKGYKYKGAGTVGDPCKVVILKEKVIKAVCKSTPFGLTTPFDGGYGMRITTGTGLEYCAELGGDTTKNDSVVLKRKNAPAPGGCSVVLPTPTPTDTRTPTNTRTPTDTPTVTNTPTITNTPTDTPTRTPTNTATDTPTPTNTFTPTSTPSVTNTPTTTATPTNTAPVHKCTFNGATDNSSLQICFLGVCPAPINVSGALDMTCDPALQDGNGKRPCQADLQTFNPFALSGVGTICIDPAGPCPDGEIDCDGGNALGLDIIADHDIGACTGNANCAGQCATYCGGLTYSVYNGACEEFCQSGSRVNLPCICDVATGATCSGGIAGVNDCPGGSCEGKDNEADTSCHCTCLDDADGGASPAGSAQIRLGIAIRVEADPVCDNVQVLVRLPAQCAPFTTGSATVTQLQPNEDGSATQGPWTESGVAGNCANFDSSSTVDFELAAGLAFMDSTIGDLQARLNVDCQ